MNVNSSEPIWVPASFVPIGTRPEAESSTNLLGSTKVLEMNQRRKMYPKEQWLALKPVIKQMYFDEGQTFTKVAEYLHEIHDFHPTKKQFMRRISEWGFEKNVKRDERRAILERFGANAHGGEFEARMLRGRRLDKAKIERWRKREGLGGGGYQTGIVNSYELLNATSNHRGASCPFSSEMELCNQDNTAEDLPRHGGCLASMLVGQQSTFNPWLVVDVVGSPGLTGLIGALTLDLCEDIPSLDLSPPYSEESEDDYDPINSFEACSAIVCGKAQNQQPQPKATSNAVSFSIAALSTYFSSQSQHRMPGPLNGISLFPKSASLRRIFRHSRTDHLISGYSLKTKELECSKRFKALKNIERAQINDLVEDMRSIAWRHSELDQFPLAELWWRRVITTCLEIPGHQPFKVLHACLQVVRNVHRQGRYKEASNLHYGVHHEIMKLVEPDHELAMLSRTSIADLKRSFGEYDSEVAMYRENLQICLLRFGTRSRDTLDVLLDLGYALIACGQYREAETLLCIRVQLDCELSTYTDPDTSDALNALISMGLLAESLNEQGRYEDSKSVLSTAERSFKDLIRVESPSSWVYLFENAKVLRHDGRLLECEELLRAVLRHGPDYATMNTIITMIELASLLTETGREEEAVTWWEKIFVMGVEIYGIEHRWSRNDCFQLGICYTQQGRYDDAILHFQHTIEKLALSSAGEIESRNEYINQIQDWIFEVEQKKEEAQTSEI